MLLWLNGASSCLPSSFFLEYVTYTWRVYTSEQAFLCFSFFASLSCRRQPALQEKDKYFSCLQYLLFLGWYKAFLFS